MRRFLCIRSGAVLRPLRSRIPHYISEGCPKGQPKRATRFPVTMTEAMMATETFTFQSDVSKLLDIVVHALYSNKQIFLRELISNAADACDRLRYVALTQPELLREDAVFRIVLIPDKVAGRLTIVDNGIGMSRDELVENLGTIARSGTVAFMNQLAIEKKTDFNMIGQFGVGFYSAFMVADRVEVITRRAETDTGHGWRWVSNGKGTFTVEEAPTATRGTHIILHLCQDEQGYLEPHRLRHLVKTYSDHIAIPVLLREGDTEEAVNEASALWTRPRNEISADQYKEFYRHVGHSFDEPWLTLHYKGEGAIEYTGLLFVPSVRPFDLFHQDRKHHIQLYVKRVFITEDCADLLPAWLRFLRGVVDSQDLPLNISREVLQHNPLLAKIRSGLVRRFLAELKNKSKTLEDYSVFWNNFGAVLKEGLYEDLERKSDIIALCRFHTTLHPERLVSLEEYVGRMKDGQEEIYYITGDEAGTLIRSPHLEGFRAKEIEVLLLTDPIDEFWPATIGDYSGRKLVSAAHASLDLHKITNTTKDPETGDIPDAQEATAANIDGLIEALKKILCATIKDVRSSDRLTESPVCLVAEQNDMSLHLERLLRQHRQIEHTVPRVLEINPRHGLIRRLADMAQCDEESEDFKEAALLLLDQARILNSETLPDPSAFTRRVTAIMERGLKILPSG